MNQYGSLSSMINKTCVLTIRMFIKNITIAPIVKCELIVYSFILNQWTQMGNIRVGNVLGGYCPSGNRRCCVCPGGGANFLRSVIFHIFRFLSKQMFAIEYHVYTWQVSPQLSCGDTCQIWMWFRESNRYFCENFAYGEISERSFSNPHPWWVTPDGYCQVTPAQTAKRTGACFICCVIIV